MRVVILTVLTTKKEGAYHDRKWWKGVHCYKTRAALFHCGEREGVSVISWGDTNKIIRED